MAAFSARRLAFDGLGAELADEGAELLGEWETMLVRDAALERLAGVSKKAAK